MDWSKTKSIFICIFLILNIFLYWQYLNRYTESKKMEVPGEKNIEARLKEDNISYITLPNNIETAPYISGKVKNFQSEKMPSFANQTVLIEKESKLLVTLDQPVKLKSVEDKEALTEFLIPSRGIIGLRTNVLTASQGEAIMAHRYKEYQPFKGEISRRTSGSMISLETGTAFAYSINNLQDRGKFFVEPQEQVYAGQVVGEHVHENDLVVNVTKAKQLTNMRASGSDEKARIVPATIFSLEEALEYIKEDEYVEVTPKNMRMRKTILDHLERKRAGRSIES